MTYTESAEMLNEFELTYNNITSNQAPGLNILEISKFLTMAQEEKVKNAFNLKGNRYQEGYDDSIKRQSDFAVLIDTVHISESSVDFKLDHRSRTFILPENIYLVLNEQVLEYNESEDEDTPVTYGNFYTVIPLRYDEYSRVMQKPYKYPPKSQVWKLVTGGSDSTSDSGIVTRQPFAEVIGRFQDGYSLQYEMRYVRRPRPIILDDLSDFGEDITIEGVNTESVCELPRHLHSEIVQRAVELAKLAWLGDINATVQAGERKE